ncbi:ead/Ea22-like family protein [Escherichia coli]|uniref:ead/Ea22-like family protein n=1 Tax=Escherichia coli TaxID=562 RepID=UPI00102008CA|nr:ead/Ea22-like family protein [Escherichia coli]EFA4828173.1 ead/Ea22-like family protein [Escherichia coli]MBS8942807.1 ead/Ea22-like family protein [Escherichia coli]MEC4625584.1 ead/Ea22-like family protein [Escherichia coli]
MTDITELAQSLKAAAEKATSGEWAAKLGDEVYATYDGVNYAQVAIATLNARDADYIAQANPASILALIEALEKARQQNKSDFEIKSRLCKESNSLHDRLREAEKRIAELESRTVKLPTWFVRDAIAVYDRDEVDEALTAAGIKTG